jgi:hypothetical protein
VRGWGGEGGSGVREGARGRGEKWPKHCMHIRIKEKKWLIDQQCLPQPHTCQKIPFSFLKPSSHYLLPDSLGICFSSFQVGNNHLRILLKCRFWCNRSEVHTRDSASLSSLSPVLGSNLGPCACEASTLPLSDIPTLESLHF